MRVLDLFSGIGGFSLGLEWAGMKTVAFCESEPYCRAVLKKHWPDTIKYDDIRTLDGTFWRGTAELVCGGFPCQPWSVAGQQRGDRDDRDLWPEMARVIGECRPRWVLGENVSGFVGNPLGLDRSLSDLEGLGYSCQAFCVPACAVGAPHRRMRAWIVGHAQFPSEDTHAEGRGSRRATGESSGDVSHAEPDLRHQPRRRHGADRTGASEPGDHGAARPLADTAQQFCNGGGHQRESRSESLPKSGNSHEATGALGDWWLAEPDVGRVAHGVPRRVDRLRALGNAVVPQVVEAIGRAIMEADSSHPAKAVLEAVK